MALPQQAAHALDRFILLPELPKGKRLIASSEGELRAQVRGTAVGLHGGFVAAQSQLAIPEIVPRGGVFRKSRQDGVVVLDGEFVLSGLVVVPSSRWLKARAQTTNCASQVYVHHYRCFLHQLGANDAKSVLLQIFTPAFSRALFERAAGVRRTRRG